MHHVNNSIIERCKPYHTLQDSILVICIFSAVPAGELHRLRHVTLPPLVGRGKKDRRPLLHPANFTHFAHCLPFLCFAASVPPRAASNPARWRLPDSRFYTQT